MSMITSAGILLFRGAGDEREVFLVHPGGPYWARKNEGAWTAPKGLVGPNEDALAAAKREFQEETGFKAEGDFRELGEFRQPGGKRVRLWAVEGDCDPAKLVSNTFSMEWPPRSGRVQDFPEVDRGAWLRRDEACALILRGQRPALDMIFGENVASEAQPSP